MATKTEDLKGLPTTDALFARLRRRTRANADDMDREIEKLCVREVAVMMCDSSGFTRKTHDYGILQFLAVMTRSYDALVPLVGKKGGSVIAHGADNLLAVFPDAAASVDAAVAMLKLLGRRNEGAADRDQFHLCIGLHWGKILRLKDNIFGDKVNVAAKIGEDLASADEILATGEIASRLPARIKRRYARSIELGGKPLELHRIVW
ncbi:MAG: hypothetical protein A2V88_14015 [Elusimicrobia bacterium RBG_16_66_12]|nr:MAG: hypothetical protein A2V88_14015 [Elusimicrobia bacterium RBG_16_66_12]